MPSEVRALSEGAPQARSSTPAQTSIGATAALVLLPNPSRKCLIIQNTGTTVLKFNLGTTTTTQTVYQFALSACGSANDGTGGCYIDDCWVGAINMISSAGGGTFVLTEVSTGNPDWNAAYGGGSTL